MLGNRYRLLDLLGAGGMGSVYRAVDELTGETVALKRVAPSAIQPITTPELRLALAHEFQALAGLRHPNIIAGLDCGFDEEQKPFYTMELLDGARPLLPSIGRAPHAVRIGLLLDLLDALRYLHRRGVLHRDLKPSNILVVEGAAGPAIKLVDFGLSTGSDEAHRHRAAGTLLYMAPELLLGAPASVASDLFAVGVLACEVLGGRRPFGPPADSTGGRAVLATQRARCSKPRTFLRSPQLGATARSWLIPRLRRCSFGAQWSANRRPVLGRCATSRSLSLQRRGRPQRSRSASRGQERHE